MANSKKTAVYYGTGRRKSSVARVYIKAGKGSIIVNEKDVTEYMPHATLVLDLKQPLTLTDNQDKFDIIAHVSGGGFTGQAGAIRLGIARALLEAGIERKTLKDNGMLTRNPRAKERKKYGLKKARKASQFSKR
ncbi:MAG: 30S ribosomal protein S9 [Bacilli bacterium]